MQWHRSLPLLRGWISASGAVEATAASTLMLQNLAKMLARLNPESYARSTWLVHPIVLPVLLGLTVVVTNVAGTENVGGSHAAAVVQGADGTLRIFGRPVLVTDACSALSSAGGRLGFTIMVLHCSTSDRRCGGRRRLMRGRRRGDRPPT
jgi:hypothetical protein